MAKNAKTAQVLSDEDLDVSAGSDLEMNVWLESAQAGQMHGVASPRDPASGMASGKRQHKPFVTT